MELQSHVQTVSILVSSIKSNYLFGVVRLLLNSAIIVSAILIQSPDLYGQHDARKSLPGAIQPKLIKDKPAVEISRVSRSPVASGQEKDEILLRLSNNYKWDISICLYGVAMSGGPLRIQYGFEEIPKSLFDVEFGSSESASQDPNSQLPKIPRSTPPVDICKVQVVKSGNSILFSVPRAHFVLKARLRVDFYFSWENISESRTLREPRHSVFFYSRELVTE